MAVNPSDQSASGLQHAPVGDHVVKTCLVPWDDAAFRSAFKEALVAVRQTELDLDAPSTADRLEKELRNSGYITARVRYWRSAAEALQHVAHWEVRRNGDGG